MVKAEQGEIAIIDANYAHNLGHSGRTIIIKLTLKIFFNKFI